MRRDVCSETRCKNTQLPRTFLYFPELILVSANTLVSVRHSRSHNTSWLHLPVVLFSFRIQPYSDHSYYNLKCVLDQGVSTFLNFSTFENKKSKWLKKITYSSTLLVYNFQYIYSITFHQWFESLVFGIRGRAAELRCSKDALDGRSSPESQMDFVQRGKTVLLTWL